MFKALRIAAIALLASPLLSGAASAQEFSLGFSKKLGRHSSIRVGYRTAPRPSYTVRPRHHVPVFHAPVSARLDAPICVKSTVPIS